MVSVIIAVYNGEKFVNRAIASALNQDIQDLEVIIVDDCSKDNTRDVIYKEYGSLIGKRISYYRNSENLERSRSRNIGFDLSKGDYVFFLDYDDEWEKDYIKESLKYFEKGYDIVYSAPRSFIDKDSKILRISQKTIPQDAEKLIFTGYIGYPSASAFKRSSFLRYREDVVLREDWEIYLRSYFSGLKIKILDNNRVKIREHGGRSSRNIYMLSVTMKIYEEYIHKVPKEYKRDFLFHMAEMNLRFGNLPLGWKFFFKSLSLSTLSNPRNLLSLVKRGFRIDRYFHYLMAT